MASKKNNLSEKKDPSSNNIHKHPHISVVLIGFCFGSRVVIPLRFPHLPGFRVPVATSHAQTWCPLLGAIRCHPGNPPRWEFPQHFATNSSFGGWKYIKIVSQMGIKMVIYHGRIRKQKHISKEIPTKPLEHTKTTQKNYLFIKETLP